MFENVQVVKDTAQQLGIDPEDIGSHSNRKGSGSYLVAGTTAAPNIVAVYLRLGWKLEGVSERYLRYSEAGDQFVGRTVCGISPFEAAFAWLPPFFPEHSPAVQEAFDACFKDAPAHLTGILHFCLASLVYHADWLLEVLPRAHKLRQTGFFTRVNHAALKPLVACRLAQPDDRIQPTGIPPISMLFARLATLEGSVNALQARISGMVNEVVSGVGNLLEERSVQGNQLTRTGLRETFPTLLAQQLPELLNIAIAPLASVVTQLAAQSGITPAGSAAPASALVQPRPRGTFVWGGKYRRVPQDYVLPKVNILLGFHHYVVGDLVNNYPPVVTVRSLEAIDMGDYNSSTATNTKRSDLNKFKRLYAPMEAYLREHNLWIDQPTVAQLNKMYDDSIHLLDVPDTTPQNKKRLVPEYTWMSLVRAKTATQKKARTAPARSAADQE